jgi:hypothetical protein
VAVDELGFVKAYGRFHKRIVQGIAEGADGAGNARLDQRLGKDERGVLGPGVRVKPNSG